MRVKLLVMVVGLFLICGCVTRQNYIKMSVSDNIKKLPPKIAIIQENWDNWWVSDFVPKALITELVGVDVKIIERTQLVTILKELKFQRSGAVKGEEEIENKSISINPLDKENIKKLGQIWGVDAMLMVYVVPEVEKRGIDMATFRLIDVETSEVILSITVTTDWRRNEITDILSDVAENIKKAFEKEITTIEELLKDKKYYDGKKVLVNGFVNDIEHISKEGKRYTEFILSDEKKNEIKVSGTGRLSINDGDNVKVEGTFKITRKITIEIVKAKVEKIEK